MKRWLFGFFCGVVFMASIPLLSPETSRALMKTSREISGNGKGDRTAAPPKAPAPETQARANPEPIRERFFPIDERPQAPIPVPTLSLTPDRVVGSVDNAAIRPNPAAAISGPVPMPRPKPASLRAG